MQDYLERHFLTASQVAESIGLSNDELDRLVEARVVPQPSYVVLPDRIVSVAFGELANDGANPGSYFAASQIHWLARALDAGKEPLEAAFREEMAVALAEADRSIHRMPDAFDDQGKPLPGLTARIDTMWGHFLNGVFALCVVESGSIQSIARKEILQERLTLLSESAASLAAADRGEVAQLIDDYARAAMPFSPAEFSRSSRKRLVDDLRERLSLQDGQSVRQFRPAH